MVSVCLPSDALLQHLLSYLGFSYLGRGVSLHGCSSKVQPFLLTLDKGYRLTAGLPDLQHGIAPLGPPVPPQPRLLGRLLCFFKHYYFFNNLIYLFYFGCARSSLLGGLFSSCSDQGLLSSCRVWTSHCSDFSCFGTQALGQAGFSRCGMWVQ